jgi:hypothetical protein
MAQLRQRYGSDDVVSKYNNTGATILKGSSVQMDTTTDQIVNTSATTAPQFGIAMVDIPDKTWGDIQKGGCAIALVGAGGVTPGVKVGAAVGGTCVAIAPGGGVNANYLGMSNTTAANTEYCELELAGSFLTFQG